MERQAVLTRLDQGVRYPTAAAVFTSLLLETVHRACHDPGTQFRRRHPPPASVHPRPPAARGNHVTRWPVASLGLHMSRDSDN